MQKAYGYFIVAWGLAVFSVFLNLSHGVAGTTGKIAGTVKDAESGEPLIGANVMIIGTTMGAATDMEGDYFILNIPPGNYTLQVSFIGYSSQQKLQVMASIDHTTRVDFELPPQAVTGEEVLVTAEHYEVIAPDVSNSRNVIAAEQMREQAAVDFEDLLSNQTSIDLRMGTRQVGGSFGGGTQDQDYTFSEGVRIRGGSIAETMMLMDGLNVQEELTNTGFTNFNLSAIRSVEVITGGFNAEFGNIRSGLINVITKEGGQKYHGGLHFRGRKPGVKHHGPALYDPSTNMEWQIFGVPQSLTSHPQVAPNRDLRQDFLGWEDWAAKHDPLNYRDLGRPDPNRPNNLLNAAQWQELWKFRSRIRKGELDPQRYWDEYWDFHLGGSLWPGGERLTFFSTYNREKVWFPLPNSLPYGTDDNLTLKLAAKVNPNLKITLQGMYNKRVGVALYKNPDVQAFSPVAAVWASRYSMSENQTDFYLSRSISEQKSGLLGLNLNHVINSGMFYEVKVSWFDKRWDNHAPRARKSLFDENGNLIPENIALQIDVTDQVNPQYYDPATARNLIRSPEGRFYYVYNEAPAGFCPQEIVDEFGRTIGGGNDEVFDSYSKKLVASVDLSAQVNKFNLIKAGMEYTGIDMSQFESQWKPGRNRRWFYARKPQRFAAYLQDKLEFKGMILNAGIRLDWGNSGGIVYDKDPFSRYFWNDKITEVMGWSYPDNIGRPQDLSDPFPNIPRRKAKSRFAISPRFGISHPMTEASKIYFNFGYFHQEPENRELYMFYVRDANDLYLMGNPNLDYEQTIAYELGYEQSLFDAYRLHLAGFYRDQSNLVKAFIYRDLSSNVNYRSFNNDGYGETTGLELRFEKRTGRFVTGSLSYDYYSSSFGETGISVFQQGEKEGEVRPAGRVGSNRWLEKPQPYFRANLNLHTPMNWGPRWSSFYPLGGWSLDVLHEWVAGRWFTYNEFDEFGPEEFVESNMQWRDHLNTNLKLTKSFEAFGFQYRAYMQVNNLFNRRELYPDETLWDTDDQWDAYMQSLRLPQRQDILDDKGNVVVKRHGNDRPGDYPITDDNGNVIDKGWIRLPNFT